MKSIKKMLALVVAMVMVLGMSTMAFAEGEGKTIKFSGGKAGHTYNLYQIFTGTVEGDELTNIQWGNGVKDAFKATKSTAAAYAKEIATAGDARATAQALVAGGSLQNPTAKALSTDDDVEFTGLAEGYYILVDASGPDEVTEGDYYSALIVKVVKDIPDGKLKGSGTTSEKKVADKNDSTNADYEKVGSPATEWQDSADYDIGDDVPFQLKATTADNVAAYKKYHITFQDKQSAGLDAPASFTITVPGTTETMSLAYDATAAVTKEVTFGTGEEAVTVVVKAEKATPATDRTFAIKVSFENKKTGELLPAGLNTQPILVNYTSKLNNSAKFGVAGNPNEMYITYSSNPESADDHEEGKTPDDKVTVFTYKMNVDKTDQDGNALKGAGFTLYKKNASSTYEAIGDEIKGEDLTSFVWKGLDDGSYKLVETTVPTGFNKAEDVTFDVVAIHDSNSDDPELKELNVENVKPTTATIAADKEKGSAEAEANLTTSVVNKSGTVLPSTGGIGTTIFYAMGAILVLGAGILLVSKRRAA